MMKKLFIPCIYLKKGLALKSMTDAAVISMDPAQLAKTYSQNNADEILVFDLSDGDAEHEEAIDVIKQICKESEVPVIGAGHIVRMEDVKKLLYAGCARA